MAKVQHTCTGCVPIDASIIDVYVTLVQTNQFVTDAETGRALAEAARVTAENARTATFSEDHSRAVTDHTNAQTAINNANAAAAAANAAGITSASASVDSNVGTPSVDVSLVNKQLSLSFHNIKGEKGEKGDRGDGAIPVVNDLVTGGTNAALSAEMGKTLNTTKQATLVSGTNIKTVNGESLLGEGNIVAGDPNAVKYVAQTLTDAQKAQARTNIDSYQKPSTGIPATDLASAAQTSLGKADTAYQKPSGGIPKTDLDSGVQGSLDLADSAIQARPMGEVDPTITPADYATTEELSELEAEVSEHIDLGNWNIGSIAPGPSSITDYASTTRLRMKEQKAISKSGNYKITCASGYLFLIYVVGKISTATWTNNRTVSLDAGDIYRIAIKTDPESDFSGYTQEQVNNVVSSANVQMTGGYIVQKMADDVADLSAKSNRLMADFSYSEVAIFNGTNAYCELNTPIVLSQNGDSIEITAIDIEATNGAGGGYAFGYGGSTSKIGIACGQTCRGWRADDGTWAGQADNIPSLGTAQIIKIEYADNKVYFSINGVAISTSATQKTLTINGFGRTAPTQYGYWKGKIANIKHNGNEIYLSEVSTFYNVTFDKSGTHLTEEQQKAVNPKLMAKKSSGYLHIYRKNALNQYIHYVLMKRALEYSEGVYPSNYDVWEIVNIFLSDYVGGSMVDTLKLTAPSQYEIAMNTPSAESIPVNRYVCGANHGFEKIIVGDNGREFQIMIDGEIVGEDATFDLKAINSVECIQHSEIFKAYSENDKIAEATKIWSISPEQELTIKMSVVFTVSTSVHQMQMGMFGAFRRVDGNTSNQYLTNRAIKDSNPFKIYDVSDGWSIASLQNTDNGCFRITEYGEKGFGLSLIVLESNRTPNGGMFVNTNNSVYNKMYNDVTGDKSVSVSEEYHATVRFEVA